MGAKCRLALHCITWQSAPFRACLFRFSATCAVGSEAGSLSVYKSSFRHCHAAVAMRTHTLLVLFTSSAPPIPLLLQHLALSLHRSPLNHSSSPPYLSPSVSRYRTPSTYSGYTFIHLPQSPCSLDIPGLDIQPIVNDLFTVTSSFSATQSTPPSVLSFCTYPPHRPPPHPLTPFFQKPCFVPFISRGKMLHIVNFSHCTTPRRIGFQRQTLCLNCSGN